MSFQTEAQDPNAQLNIVLKIDDTYFSQYTVDSGLVVDADKIGLIRTARLSPNKVDIRDVKTSIATLTFDLIDTDEVISIFVMGKDNNHLEDKVTLFVGFITGSFDFSEYEEFTSTNLKTISKGDNKYSFSCSEITSIIKKEAFFTENQLNGGIDDVATSLTLDDASSFPSSGQVKIDAEYIVYTSKTGDTLENLSRGDLSGTATDHEDGALVSLVTLIEDNSIDMMLDIMQNTLGIATSDIDITSFTDIRDNFQPTTDERFFITGLPDVLTFFEDEILLPINCRMTSLDGLIGLIILDETDFKTQPRDLDEDAIIGTPRWSIGSSKIVNKIEVEWGYSEGTDSFSRITPFEDDDSVGLFGVKKTLKYQFKGVKADLDGASIVNNMGARLLARTKTTQANIKANSFFTNSDLKVGDDVSLTHRFLPQQGGSLGMADQRLEIMSKGFDFDSKRITFDLQFTSFSNLRVGLISPSPFIVSVISQREFEVPIGSQYKAGYFLRLWNTATNDYYADPINLIESVTGNIIKMVADFTTTLTTSVKVKFPVYSESSSIQTGKYGYICPNSGFFNDTTKCYEIVF